MPCKNTVDAGARITEASDVNPEPANATAGNAAEQAIVQAASPPFISCCDVSSGQCSIGTTAAICSWWTGVAAVAMPSGMSSTASRTSSLEASLVTSPPIDVAQRQGNASMAGLQLALKKPIIDGPRREEASRNGQRKTLPEHP